MIRLAMTFTLAVCLACSRGAATAWAQSTLDGVVRGRDGVVTDAAVFLAPVGDSTAVRPTTARIDQLELMFVPRIVVVTPGSTVEFPNSDAVLHNVFHPGNGTRGFDLGTYPRPEARTFTFQEVGLFVMLCHVHPEMVGFVAVVPSEHRATTNEDGRFVFAGVPAGEYRLHVWHRRFADPDMPITVRGKRTTVSPMLLPADTKRPHGTP
ncbi:MAG: carboxypeptidase regulatory-like domain-containing protein [Gemmatimonas sp.]